jgi:hypothetical protein
VPDDGDVEAVYGGLFDDALAARIRDVFEVDP